MDKIIRRESSAECDDRRLSSIELNEVMCSVLFNSINVRKFQFLSLWKITCEYYTNLQNLWCVRASVYSSLCKDDE